MQRGLGYGETRMQGVTLKIGMDFRHIKNCEIGTYVEGGVGGKAPRGKNF